MELAATLLLRQLKWSHPHPNWSSTEVEHARWRASSRAEAATPTQVSVCPSRDATGRRGRDIGWCRQRTASPSPAATRAGPCVLHVMHVTRVKQSSQGDDLHIKRDDGIQAIDTRRVTSTAHTGCNQNRNISSKRNLHLFNWCLPKHEKSRSQRKNSYRLTETTLINLFISAHLYFAKMFRKYRIEDRKENKA